MLSISLVFDDVPTIRLNDIEIRWMSAGVLLLQMIDIMISVCVVIYMLPAKLNHKLYSFGTPTWHNALIAADFQLRIQFFSQSFVLCKLQDSNFL